MFFFVHVCVCIASGAKLCFTFVLILEVLVVAIFKNPKYYTEEKRLKTILLTMREQLSYNREQDFLSVNNVYRPVRN